MHGARQHAAWPGGRSHLDSRACSLPKAAPELGRQAVWGPCVLCRHRGPCVLCRHRGMQHRGRPVSLCCTQDACRPQARVMHGCLSCWRMRSNVGARKGMMLQARYWRPRLHRSESHRCWRVFCALGVSIGHILQKPDYHSGQGHRQDFSQASQVIFHDTARSAQGGRHSPHVGGISLASKG